MFASQPDQDLHPLYSRFSLDIISFTIHTLFPAHAKYLILCLRVLWRPISPQGLKKLIRHPRGHAVGCVRRSASEGKPASLVAVATAQGMTILLRPLIPQRKQRHQTQLWALWCFIDGVGLSLKKDACSFKETSRYQRFFWLLPQQKTQGSESCSPDSEALQRMRGDWTLPPSHGLGGTATSLMRKRV